MKPAEVLKRLRELRDEWRKQGFSFYGPQKEEYERLRKLRQERVQYFIDNGLVFKGTKKAVEKKVEGS